MPTTLQNFYKQTILIACTSGATTIYLTTKPTVSSGYLVISPNNSSLREIVQYTATGTDGTGDFITVSVRGVGGTTAQSHVVGEPIRMNITAQHWADLNADIATKYGTGSVIPTPILSTDASNKAYVDALAITGTPAATNSLSGRSKLSVASGTPTDPIVVETSDPRVPTQNENDAMVGTSGTAVSSSNKLIDNAYTVGTGAVQRATALANYGLSKTTLVAGSAITAGQAVSLSRFIQSDGGIIFDNSTNTGYASTTNQSMVHTVGTGANRYLLVAIVCNSTPTLVQYSGVTMSLVDSVAISGVGNSFYLYKLAAPVSGSNSVSVTATGITGISANSYANVNQATGVEASAKTGTSLTISGFSTISGGAGIQAIGFTQGLSGSFSTATSNFTSKYSSAATNANLSTGYLAGYALFVSSFTGKINETLTTTITQTSTTTGGGSPTFAMFAISLAPATTTFSFGVLPTNSSISSANDPLIDFIGFADSTVAVGANVSITTSSGLTPGRIYYLQNTNGTIATTMGTYGKEIGKALSSTTLQIASVKTIQGTGIAKVNSYTYTAETDGMIGTSTSTYPISKGSTYSFAGGTNFFYPIA
jgi:hypothetical protein